MARAFDLLPQVQLCRIQLRVPEYGWTTQKVFHLLNCLVAIIRCSIFFFRPQLERLHPPVTKLMLLDLPGGAAGRIPLRMRAHARPAGRPALRFDRVRLCAACT